MQHVTFEEYSNSSLQQLPATHHWLSSACDPVLVLNPFLQLHFLTECMASEAVSPSILTTHYKIIQHENFLLLGERGEERYAYFWKGSIHSELAKALIQILFYLSLFSCLHNYNV